MSQALFEGELDRSEEDKKVSAFHGETFHSGFGERQIK